MGSSVAKWMKDNAPHIASMSVRESAVLCLGVIHKARIGDAVSFYASDGSTIPW